MQGGSSLARLLRAVTLAIIGLALAWLVHRWPASPLHAVAGALGIALGYTVLLALQCVLLGFASQGDTAPRPAPRELVRAWWGEACQVPRVFFWRQPFRWRAAPDQAGAAARGRRGVVFIHGFICNRGFWTPWLQRLRAEGIPFVAVNLEPVFGSIDDYAPIIDRAVRQLSEATGQPPVLVCHSMGGLVARAWLRAVRDASRVHGVVTIGTPHHGTWLARFSHTRNGREMRRDSGWQGALAQDEAGRILPPFICWYSHCDNIVFPTSSGTLAWADNRLVRGPAHVELAFHPQVMDDTLALVTAAVPPLRPM